MKIKSPEATFSGKLRKGPPEFYVVPPGLWTQATALHATAVAWLERHAFIRGVSLFTGVTVCLTLLSHIFNRLIPMANDWAIYWPFNAIVVAVLIMSRRSHWPWIVAGFIVAFLRLELLASEPPADIATDIAGNTVQVIAAAFSLPAFRSLKTWMMEPRLFQRFILFAVLLIPLLSSAPVARHFDHLYHFGFWHIMMKWGFTDSLGIALWTPLVLILFSRETYQLFRWRALPETVGLLSTLYGVTWITFDQGRYPIAFLPYPFLLLVALRLGFSGAVIGANMLALLAASLSLRGHGPFTTLTHAWNNEQTVVLQVYSTLAMLFVLPLSVMLIERRNFEEQLQEAFTEMKRLATEDQLTGVANRRRFDQVLNVEWKRAERAAAPVALLMIDADCFKLYNDRYGHLAGDECLCRIAKSISAEPLRPHDLVARYGGEEFAVILSGATPARLEEIAQNMRLGVEATNLLHEGNPHGKVTISIGCASIVPTPHAHPKDLIAAADAALYTAKQNGRNCIHNAVSPAQQPTVKLRA